MDFVFSRRGVQDYQMKVAETVEAAYRAICERIDRALKASHRVDSVDLLAVSKYQGIDKIRAAYAVGQRHFGENYLQEALEKQSQCADLDIIWHFIGQIQRRKASDIARHFDWVVSVDRFVVAELLSAHRPADAAPLNVCIQVNISGESQKGGLLPAEVLDFAHQVAVLPRLSLRGVMGITSQGADDDMRRVQFGRLREVFVALQALGLPVDVLSMGMSVDMDLAIEMGSTCVRIGTALFGKRPEKQ